MPIPVFHVIYMMRPRRSHRAQPDLCSLHAHLACGDISTMFRGGSKQLLRLTYSGERVHEFQ